MKRNESKPTWLHGWREYLKPMHDYLQVLVRFVKIVNEIYPMDWSQLGKGRANDLEHTNK